MSNRSHVSRDTFGDLVWTVENASWDPRNSASVAVSLVISAVAIESMGGTCQGLGSPELRLSTWPMAILPFFFWFGAWSQGKDAGAMCTVGSLKLPRLKRYTLSGMPCDFLSKSQRPPAPLVRGLRSPQCLARSVSASSTMRLPGRSKKEPFVISRTIIRRVCAGTQSWHEAKTPFSHQLNLALSQQVMGTRLLARRFVIAFRKTRLCLRLDQEGVSLEESVVETVAVHHRSVYRPPCRQNQTPWSRTIFGLCSAAGL